MEVYKNNEKGNHKKKDSKNLYLMLFISLLSLLDCKNSENKMNPVLESNPNTVTQSSQDAKYSNNLNASSLPFFQLDGIYFLGTIIGKTINGITPFCLVGNDSERTSSVSMIPKCNYIKGGKILSPYWFKKVFPFSEGLGRIQDSKNLFGFLSEEGIFAIQPIFAEANDFSDGLGLVEQNFKQFYLDREGKIKLTPPSTLTEVYPFRDGLALVRKNETFGFIDPTGRLVLPLQFFPDENFWMSYDPTPMYFQYGFSIVQNPNIDPETGRNLSSLIDKKGKIVLNSPHYLTSFVRLKDKVLLVSENSCEAYPGDGNAFQKTECSSSEKDKKSEEGTFKSDRNRVGLEVEETGSGDVLLKDNGGIVFPLKKSTEPILFTLPNHNLFINFKGEAFYNDTYDQIGELQENRIAVTLNEKNGFIDSEFKVVIPLQFEEVTSFSGGIAGYRKGELWGLIDKNGKILVEAKFDNLNPPSEGMTAVQKKEKWGLLNASGKIVIPFMYDNIGTPKEGMVAVGKEGEEYFWQYRNYKGEIAIAKKFSENKTFENGKMKNISLGKKTNDFCSFDKKGKGTFCFTGISVNLP